MDTDALIAVHQAEWDRLAELLGKRRLDGPEIDELVSLYQRTTTQLSVVRSTNPDPQLTARLSVLLARARWRITGVRVPLWRHARDVLWNDLPAALWSARWSTAIAAGILLVSALVVGTWFGLDAEARASVLSETEQQSLTSHHFVDYYFQGQAGGFAANVWSNNAWIAVQSVVFGVTGAWPVWMLLQNGMNVGLIGGVMASHGALGTFFAYILPHGLLEMTAIAVGAGAGLRVFWSWVRPGPLPRLWSLARAARALVTVAIGLVPVLFVSGILEAFVTPSPLPTALRLVIGIGAWVLFLVFAYGRGRAAHREGVSGDLSEDMIGDRVAVAA